MELIETRTDTREDEVVILTRDGDTFYIRAESGFQATIPLCACEDEDKCKRPKEHWSKKRINEMFDRVCISHGIKKEKKK